MNKNVESMVKLFNRPRKMSYADQGLYRSIANFITTQRKKNPADCVAFIEIQLKALAPRKHALREALERLIKLIDERS